MSFIVPQVIKEEIYKGQEARKLEQETKGRRHNQDRGASLVDQYPSTLVLVVGFKIIKNRTNKLQVLGDEGFKVGCMVVYNDWGIKKEWGEGFKYWEGVSTKRVVVNIY